MPAVANLMHRRSCWLSPGTMPYRKVSTWSVLDRFAALLATGSPVLCKDYFLIFLMDVPISSLFASNDSMIRGWDPGCSPKAATNCGETSHLACQTSRRQKWMRSLEKRVVIATQAIMKWVIKFKINVLSWKKKTFSTLTRSMIKGDKCRTIAITRRRLFAQVR